jgi:hypothetical protein
VRSELIRERTLTRLSDDRYRLGEGGAWPTLAALIRHTGEFEAKAS